MRVCGSRLLEIDNWAIVLRLVVAWSDTSIAISRTIARDYVRNRLPRRDYVEVPRMDR